MNGKTAYVFDTFAIWYEIASQYWLVGMLADCEAGNFRGFNIADDLESICPREANWMKYDNGEWIIDTEMKLTCIYEKKSVEYDMYTTEFIRS